MRDFDMFLDCCMLVVVVAMRRVGYYVEMFLRNLTSI